MLRPIPHTPVPEHLRQPLAAAVGEMVIAWGQLEWAVNGLIALIYREAGGRRAERHIPRSFAPKLRFLRHSFAQVAALRTHQNRAARLINHATELSRKRNAIVHGAVSGFSEKTKRIRFSRLETEDNVQQERSFDISIAELLDLTDRSRALTDEIRPFLMRVAEEFAEAKAGS